MDRDKRNTYGTVHALLRDLELLGLIVQTGDCYWVADRAPDPDRYAVKPTVGDAGRLV